MHKRRLGQSDIEVSVITMGCWAIVGDATWGAQDRGDAIAAIRTSLDLGVTSFDTAPLYGQGLSERLLGEALAGRREQAVILDKVSSQHLAPDALRQSVEQSLRDLGSDYIDVLQIHWPNWDQPLEETLIAMRQLREQGKIRAVAVSNFGQRDLCDALAIEPDIVANQLSYSLLARQIEHQVQPICLEHDVSILCYCPLAQGLLTGKFRHADDVPAGRARTRHFAAARGHGRHGEPGCEAETFAAIKAIGDLAREHNLEMGTLALAWLLARPAVACVLPGARNSEQAIRNAQAAQVQLGDDLIARLDAITQPVKRLLGDRIDLWTSAADTRMR